jgi:hypothetical protein
VEPLVYQLAQTVFIMITLSVKLVPPNARPVPTLQPAFPATLQPLASINISAKVGVTHPARTPTSVITLLFAEIATRTARLALIRLPSV